MTTNNSRNIFHNINNVSRKSVSSDKPNQQKVLTMTNNDNDPSGQLNIHTPQIR